MYITTQKISSSKISRAEIYISDILGRKQKIIFSGNLDAGENNFSVDMNDWAGGIYFVRVVGENVSGAVKVVKE